MEHLSKSGIRVMTMKAFFDEVVFNSRLPNDPAGNKAKSTLLRGGQDLDSYLASGGSYRHSGLYDYLRQVCTERKDVDPNNKVNSPFFLVRVI